MTIAIIDGMGGGIGAQLVERLTARLVKDGVRDATVIALGTNAVATRRMVDAGAVRGASGENAIRVSVRSADVIIGPIGIVLPDAMMGEVSPAIAEAVFTAVGKKILIPLSQTHLTLVGIAPKNVSELVDEAVEAAVAVMAGK